MTRGSRLISAAVIFSALSGGALLGCQRYEVDPVTPAAAKLQKKVSQQARQVAPNVVIVVDRSGSMTDSDTGSAVNSCAVAGQQNLPCKWDELLTALTGDADKTKGFVYQLDYQSRQGNPSDPVRLGLVTFSGMANDGNSGDSCSQGKLQVAPVANPSSAQVDQIDTVLTQIVPKGGTPTASTLMIAKQALDAVKETGRNNYVVLLTDGSPNCNGSWNEGWQRCIDGTDRCASQGGCYSSSGAPEVYAPSGCLDENNTVSTVSALHAAGISTFVIGFGADFSNTSSAANETLNQCAVAGGTARSTDPKFYRASSAQDLQDALNAIAAIVRATCTYSLDAPPASSSAVEVVVTPPNGTAQTLTDKQYAVTGSTVTITDPTLCSAITSTPAGSTGYKVEIDYLSQ